MKQHLNDFQFKWYMCFEEEYKKSIFGLSFDPYFEASKYSTETILDYVPQAKRPTRLETLLLDFTADCLETLFEIPKFFGTLMLTAIDEFCESDSASQIVFYACFPAGAYLEHFVLGLELGWLVLWPVTLFVGGLIVIPVVIALAALRYLIDCMPHAYTFIFAGIMMSLSVSLTSEAAINTEDDNPPKVHHVFVPDDQPSAEQFCSLVEQTGQSWFYKYMVNGDDVYLVESHRSGNLDNPVLLNKDEWYEAVYIVKKLHSECMQNFK